MRFHSLNDADVLDKRGLLRVDLNVHVSDGRLSDTTRIERTAAATIREIADRGGKAIRLPSAGRSS
jgi:phosphoglycerate kinase